MTTTPTLELRNLEVAYTVRGIDRQVLRGVSFSIAPGEAYGLVGESGCGKSTAAFAAMRYLPRNGKITNGSILFEGKDIVDINDDEVAKLRRSAISMVYQNPATALNPTIRIGKQIAEVFELNGVSSSDAMMMAEQALTRVQIADPARVLRRYAHQLSGGMAQRVVIAMALASNPRLLVMDEPTTGLDATVEAEVLDLVRELRRDTGTAVLFISHNLGVIRNMCDRVGVLYAGALVEQGATSELFSNPSHPYTVGLLRCIPRGGLHKSTDRLDTIPGTPPALGTNFDGCVFAARCSLADDKCRTQLPEMVTINGSHVARCFHSDKAGSMPRSIEQIEYAPQSTGHKAQVGDTLLNISHLSKVFNQDGSKVRVINDVSLTLGVGETLGLVGESGSGKTTIAKLVLGLTPPEEGGVVTLDGKGLAKTLNRRDVTDVGAMQIVFQNPDQALNRRHSVTRIVSRAVERLRKFSLTAAIERAHQLLSGMRVDASLHSVRPVQLSGGLKQRVAIARAFAGAPQIVVCDEPTSALDVSVQAAILNLLVDLQKKDQTSFIFISHDLGVVRYISDKIAVLYLGRVVEFGSSQRVFSGPFHPYTEALLSSVPNIDGSTRKRIPLTGVVPSPSNPPSGCVLNPRCPRKVGSGYETLCETEEPNLTEVEPGHFMRCHVPMAKLKQLQS
ncbi:MAG: dipeptide ABC transporter ATP-binding protein [Ilumatobacteraceae bacterium]|mgnify:FL=1|jgi:peptide/nickel transport system ATP-binding protein